MFSEFYTMETSNKFGIDPLNVMVHFMGVLECKNARTSFDRFKSYLVSQIKRGITPQEELNLSQGIVDYIKSEPGSNDRAESMKYLFGLNFLNQPQ